MAAWRSFLFIYFLIYKRLLRFYVFIYLTKINVFTNGRECHDGCIITAMVALPLEQLA